MSKDKDSIEQVVQRVLVYNPGADVDAIRRAHAYAARAHEGQKRRSGEPYIVHPVGVASLITDLKLDVPSVCAGLLHDCVEDTTASLEELGRTFSPEIAFLVDGVTKLTKLEWKSKADRQAESFRKMLLAMAKDIRVILIKLADRTHNMRTLGHMPEDRQERIARETIEIYAPLANRLGIYWIKAELEDLSFRYLYPAEYREVVDALEQGETQRRAYISRVERTLREVMDNNGIACSVKGRPKNLWGIYSKMRRTSRELEQIHDIVAFRILTGSIRDCYGALGVVHEGFKPIPGRIKDYVAMPKPNGYQSLHTSVIGPNGERMEIQIRTHEMHRIAEEGIAAHWVYKEGGGGLSSTDQQKFSWLRQLVEVQKDLTDPGEFIDAVKIDLFADEVYTFTPQGEVRAFPRGSTPVDFAYAVHTEVGNTCQGARVNGLIVPLRYKLKNGDTVEIITNPNQRPNKDWLKFVATARARSKIRHYIRREQRDRSKELGRELLDKELRKLGQSFAKLQRQGVIRNTASHFRLGTEGELMLQVGFGKLTPLQVARAALPDQFDVEEGTPIAKRGALGALLDRVRRPAVRGKSGGITVQDLDDVLVRVGHCCNPVPGDPIVGFITRGRGVTVHKRDCQRALDLDPERRIEVRWDDAASREQHPVTIEVHTADRPGLLAKMSTAFSDQKVNIASANCRATSAGRAVNTFKFSVQDVSHLNRVVKSLQRIKGVFQVRRL